jgi:hypothetical protein
MLDTNAIILIGGIVILWAVLVFLRAPATVIFFSLLVGQLLASQLADEVYDLMSGSSFADTSYISVGLLILPVLITLLLLRDHVSKSRRLIEAGPLLLAAASIIIFVDNYLDLSQNLKPDQASLLQTYEQLIVSVGAVSSLVSSWLNYPKPGKHKKH